MQHIQSSSFPAFSIKEQTEWWTTVICFIQNYSLWWQNICNPLGWSSEKWEIIWWVVDKCNNFPSDFANCILHKCQLSNICNIVHRFIQKQRWTLREKYVGLWWSTENLGCEGSIWFIRVYMGQTCWKDSAILHFRFHCSQLTFTIFCTGMWSMN